MSQSAYILDYITKQTQNNQLPFSGGVAGEAGRLREQRLHVATCRRLLALNQIEQPAVQGHLDQLALLRGQAGKTASLAQQ